jgi:hypothetical protein
MDQGAAAVSHAIDAPPAGHEGGGAAGVDVDELAEHVIDKLRREMLIERDLGGGAMDLI